MKEGLYVPVDEVKKVIDTFGAKSDAINVTVIDADFVIEELRERADMYVTPSGNIIRRSYEQAGRVAEEVGENPQCGGDGGSSEAS